MSDLQAALSIYQREIEASDDRPISKLLPLLFRLRGQPYDLGWSHFMFEPMFRLRGCPRLMLWKTARQVSKTCRISNNQHVYLANGRPVTGETIAEGDTVISYDELTGKVVTGKVIGTQRVNSKPIHRISTTMGAELELAYTHPVLTARGYITANDLTSNDRIATIKAGAPFGSQSMPLSRVKLTAYMIGDGCCGAAGHLSFTSANDDVLRDFTATLSHPHKVYPKKGSLASSISIARTGSELRTWLTEDGLWGHLAWEKFIPSWVFDLPREQATSFVECLYATDGCIRPRKNGYVVSYCTTSRRLAYELKALLLKFNIGSSVARRKTGYKKEGVFHPCRDAFIVRVVGRPSQELFLQTFAVPGKSLAINSRLPVTRSNRDTIPTEFHSLIKELCDQQHGKGKSAYAKGLRKTPGYTISVGKLQQYIEWGDSQGLDTSKLKRLQSAEITWDSIKSIERDIAVDDCWDLEIETYHNFVMDGVVVHNSTSLSSMQILRAAAQPNYNILTVMPLFEQVRKFSQNYVRPFLVTSPIKGSLIGAHGADSVLQRGIGSINHNSNLFYSYSSGDPSRVRGIAASECNFDEVQDLPIDDLPVIESCMGASPHKIVRYTGMPKTFDNTIHLLWEDSSQGIWHIPCEETGCKHLNRCAVDGDLLKMLGEKTLVCGKCQKPVNSRAGFYIHNFPERRATFPGYHVSQPILPMHYESPKDWFVLMEDYRKKPTYTFFNETLGESFDAGAKLLTKEQLEKAAVAKPEPPGVYHPDSHISTVIGADWGGRGKEKTTDTDDFISNTVFALAGLNSDGTIDIPWIYKVPYTVDLGEETTILTQAARQTYASHVAMDYGGQGNVQEQLLMSKGFPQERIIPFTYSGAMQPRRPIVFYQAPKNFGVRSGFTLDKPRSILLLVELIKAGVVRLPKSDVYIQEHLRDFLNIYEETVENPRGPARRLIRRMSRRTDDVVHAINYAVMALYHLHGAWPTLANAFVEPGEDGVRHFS
jgi:intein/homing endonuclease